MKSNPISKNLNRNYVPSLRRMNYTITIFKKNGKKTLASDTSTYYNYIPTLRTKGLTKLSGNIGCQ